MSFDFVCGSPYIAYIRIHHSIRSSNSVVRPICMVVSAFLAVSLKRVCATVLDNLIAYSQVFASFTMAVMAALRVFERNTAQGSVVVIFRLCFITFTDWFIALSLIHKLRQLQSRSKSLSGRVCALHFRADVRTNLDLCRTIRRITYMTIQTGTATSLLMLVSFILFFTAKYTQREDPLC